MKKGFLKKLAICLSLGLGVMTLAACQSTNQTDAKIGVTEFNIVQTSDGKYHAQGGIVLANNTIYNVKAWNVTYTLIEEEDKLLPSKEQKTIKETFYDEPGYVFHGQGGAIIIDKDLTGLYDDGYKPISLRCEGGVATQFDNLWNSYLGWWIAAIVIVGVALIFFAAELFGKHLSKNQIVDLFKGHVASSCVFAMFMLIICLFPLIFGAWFSTIILLIALAGSFVGGGALALIAFAAAKE